MKKSLTRRDLLKLAGLIPFSLAIPPALISNIDQNQSKPPNVLILVFDAWSAANTSLYGYPRKTTPNLERLAQRAVVYHNHYADGHFTTPGTASLLTGTTPWVHQAFNINDTVANHLVRKTIFNAFPDYHRLAYTHNRLVYTLLRQFRAGIDTLLPWQRLYLDQSFSLIGLFQNDIDIAKVSRNRVLKQSDDGVSFSLYLSRLFENTSRKKVDPLKANYPRGITNTDEFDFFILEDGIDWLSQAVRSASEPFLAYCHFYPPHDPYYTRRDFFDAFGEDRYQPPRKETHFLSDNRSTFKMKEQRRWYDEFLLYVDAEFARLYADLESHNLLENTYIFLTSDHGEMFERNIIGHSTPVFYRPVMHIPLVIFPPAQESRLDIYANTSAIDLLPTLSQVTGHAIPDWTEGSVLPPFSGSNLPDQREITSIQVHKLGEDSIIQSAAAMIAQGSTKLLWHFGFGEIKKPGEFIELYDLATDPEELHNRFSQEKGLAQDLLGILRAKLAVLNQSWQK